MSKRINAFTLLEMLIALVIISMIGALCAVQLKKLIDGHRFEKEISSLFIALQEAQVLAAAYQTDISLDIYREKGKWSYRFSTNEPFAEHQFHDGIFSLKQTAILKWQEKKIDAFHLDIYSGRIEPSGILTFQTQENSKTLWFDLQYGQMLKFAYNKPTLAKQRIPKREK